MVAKAYFMPLALHYGSTLSRMTASSHVAASIPLFFISEGGKGHGQFNVVRKDWKLGNDGYATLPDSASRHRIGCGNR